MIRTLSHHLPLFIGLKHILQRQLDPRPFPIVLAKGSEGPDYLTRRDSETCIGILNKIRPRTRSLPFD